MLDIWVYQTNNSELTVQERMEKTKWERKPDEKL